MIHQVKLSKHWNSLTSVQKNQVMKSLSRNQLCGIPQIDQFLLNNSCGDVLKNLFSQSGGVVPISMGNFKDNNDPQFLQQKANFEKDFPGFSLAVNEEEGENKGRVWIYNTETGDAVGGDYYEEALPSFKQQQKALKEKPQPQPEPQTSVTLQDNLQLIAELKSKIEELKKQSSQISQLQTQIQQQTAECEAKIQQATSTLQSQLTQSQQELETTKQQLSVGTASSQDMNALNKALRELLSA